MRVIGYFFEIIKGLSITAKHFFVNLFYNALRFYGLYKGEKGSVTIQYPEQRKALSPRLRAMHRLLRREDGSPRCVACFLCATVCPSECIKIVAGEYLDKPIQKYPISFEIDIGKCCWCGFCVEACPEDAIRMDNHYLDFTSYTRKELILDLKKLMEK
jgi:NADH-quinone oxidoreductase subunit I